MSDEFEGMVMDHLFDLETSDDESCWWWLSFCDTDRPEGDRFIGVSIVKARSLVEASMVAHKSGCNPGGQVYGLEVPCEFGNPPEEWDHKLVSSKERVSELTQQWHQCEAKTLAELEGRGAS